MRNSPQSRVFAEGLRGTLTLFAFPVVLLAAAWATGYRLPRNHTAIVSGIVETSPARTWELITDVAAQPAWREVPIVISRVPYDDANGQDCWYEPWVLDRFPVCATDTGQARRVLRTARPSLAFAAVWTFDLAPVAGSPGHTAVRIREDATIDPALWRFIGRYLLRRQTAAGHYLTHLQAEALHRP